jgi:hypothetical protein
MTNNLNQQYYGRTGTKNHMPLFVMNSSPESILFYLKMNAKPKMSRFKSMSMDEHVETIEQSIQEALKVREEIRVGKTTKAQRRGFLLLEGAQ